MTSLMKFKDISGLAPSLTKSSCFFHNCQPSVIQWFNFNYAMPRGSIPVKFLGVPLISSRLSINDCMPLIQRLTSRIEYWTCILLSFMGRLQLIKVVLHAMVSFWTKHFILPTKVHKQIQSLLTKFLWKGKLNSNGGARISWNQICLPKREGGLGLKNLVQWNRAQILNYALADYHKKKHFVGFLG